ncbi:MAG: protein kinase [Candidatus Contendobacter sp.]|nr:protein kinase [Candidatus Contendobacter sp.]MDG4559265.1 protein kinase [Candidatus Contendobacter sp.]
MLRNGERIAIKGRSYRLDGVLSNGAGSYGQVWAATDPAGRAVAIKLINAEAMTQADPALHDHWRKHLEREINFLRGLDADRSRHVVALLDDGVVDGQPALVLERLQANLGQWLANQRREGTPPPDLAQILDWAEQVLDGLDVVHQAGFVYRDLKLSNLLVGNDGARIKLADFGSLKREDGDNTRSFIGTPATMAPEQVLPARQGAEGYEYAVDYRADYYALGLLLFALFTDQPTTAAQRRLGQLLAVYGQEGAGQRGARLGGLDDEERELLRRSIEFWTVPARPEQGGGAAALLVELIDRLLARDPADRPADAGKIRAALGAARVDPTAAPILVSRRTAASLAGSPNRHSHRDEQPWSRFWPRWALLAGAVGLAGALAGAMIRPVDEAALDRAEPLSAVIAPPTAKSPEPAAPATEPVLSASSSPAATNPALALEPAAPPLPTDAAPVAEASEPPPIADAPVAEAPEPPPIADAPVAEAPEPPPIADAPVVETPEPADAPAAPARSAPTESQAAVEPRSKSRSPATVATPRPAVAEPRPPVRPRPAVGSKPGKPIPAPAVAADRPAAVERSPVVGRPPAAPTTASRTVKPTPPAAPEPPQRPPVTARTTPRDNGSSHPADRARPVPSVASRPPTTPKPASKPADSVARPGSPSRVASRSEPVPVLPPIKLESRAESTPTLPPIRLESRPQSAPPAQPPIELVSRSSTAASTARPAPAVARAEPRPPSRSATSPARSADSMTQLRDDAGRTAAEVGNFFSRASATVGKEVRRGLEAADQTVGRWTGRCQPGDGCQEVRVERRDRWSDRHRGGNTVSQRGSAARYDEDDGFARPPPRPYRDDYR